MGGAGAIHLRAARNRGMVRAPVLLWIPVPVRADLEVSRGRPQARAGAGDRVSAGLSLLGLLLACSPRTAHTPTRRDTAQQVGMDEIPDRLEEFWFNINQSLQAIGPAPMDRLVEYRYVNRALKYKNKTLAPRKLIKEAVKEGDLLSVRVRELDEKWYLLPEQEELLTDIDHKTPEEYHVSFLSPLDSALWTRDSILKQYSYYYKMESYTPKAKRKYGFFALSILFGPDFVGRVDPKYDRKSKTMNFIKWSWEPGFAPDNIFWSALAIAVRRFADFHGAEKIDFGDLKKGFKKNLLEYMQ